MNRPFDPRTRRTGAIGRSARVTAAIVLSLTVALQIASLLANGAAHYRDPDFATDPSVWIASVILVAAFVDVVTRFAPTVLGIGRVRASVVLAGLVAIVGVAAVIGWLASGSVWGAPLADLWWWFITAMTAQIAVSFMVAAVVGTSGCEQGVWQELARRGRRGDGDVHACVLGLHRLDAWERRRADRRAARAGPRSGRSIP